MEQEHTNAEERMLVIEQKLDAIYASVEKTRKYFLIITWVTIAMVVLPAIGLVFVIPMFINNYVGALNGVL